MGHGFAGERQEFSSMKRVARIHQSTRVSCLERGENDKFETSTDCMGAEHITNCRAEQIGADCHMQQEGSWFRTTHEPLTQADGHSSCLPSEYPKRGNRVSGNQSSCSSALRHRASGLPISGRLRILLGTGQQGRTSVTAFQPDYGADGDREEDRAVRLPHRRPMTTQRPATHVSSTASYRQGLGSTLRDLAGTYRVSPSSSSCTPQNIKTIPSARRNRAMPAGFGYVTALHSTSDLPLGLRGSLGLRGRDTV
jgi:hypothetical protein